MGVVVTFEYNNWVARYPEFSDVDSGLAQEYFNEAAIYHRNDGGGPVKDRTSQSVLLNMLTAHIAQLYKLQQDGTAVSELVGRIDSASEGSVNVSATFDAFPGTAQWYNSTKYGASYWAASAVYRTMRYRPGPRRIFNPLFGGRPFW